MAGLRKYGTERGDGAVVPTNAVSQLTGTSVNEEAHTAHGAEQKFRKHAMLKASHSPLAMHMLGGPFTVAATAAPDTNLSVYE